MKVLIGGDLVPTDSNKDVFSSGNMELILDNGLINILESSDIKIFNLEVPLADEETPIKKCGPNLIAPTSTIKGIKRLNPTLISLANNHILDHGENGLKSTLRNLDKYDIPYVGVGKDIKESSKPYIIKKFNLNIGIYSCAQSEFSIATKESMGSNPFDPLESLDHISELRQKCDYVIVLYHGGIEHYRYPSPYLQKICRKMAEKGADLVVCQHSHCIGSLEKFKHSTIVYGQGNFLFNKYDNEFWNNGLLIQCNINDSVELEFIPIVKENNGIRIASEIEKELILKEFYKRSEDIKNHDFIENEFIKLAKSKEKNYLSSIAGLNRWIRKLNSILDNKLIKRIYNTNNRLKLTNYIQSEDHRELILKTLKCQK